MADPHIYSLTECSVCSVYSLYITYILQIVSAKVSIQLFQTIKMLTVIPVILEGTIYIWVLIKNIVQIHEIQPK